MSTISVRIPDDMKEQMDQHPEVNWSNVIRQKLADELDAKQEKQLSRALLSSETLIGKPVPDDVTDQNSAERIRSFRENR